MSRSRSVTGPRRPTPPVEYAKRTSRSPLDSSSSCTTEAKRFSPDCCRTVTSSTRSACPHGVAVFAMTPTVRGKATRVCAAFPQKASRRDGGELGLRAEPVVERVVPACQRQEVRARGDVLVRRWDDRRSGLLAPDHRLARSGRLGGLRFSAFRRHRLRPLSMTNGRFPVRSSPASLFLLR